MLVKEAKAHVQLAIGSKPSFVDPLQTVDERIIEIINHAGRQMYTRPWRFREMHTSLDVGANSRAIALPNGFDSLVSLTRIANGGSVEMTTAEDIDRMTDSKSTSIGTNIQYAAMSFLSSKPYFLVWPTPKASEERVLRLRYHRRWAQLPKYIVDPDTGGSPTLNPDSVSSNPATGDSAIGWTNDTDLGFPAYVDALFIAYLRAYAIGYEDDNMSMRVAEVEAGPILQTALMKDGIQVRDLGRLKPQVGRPFRRR